MARLDDITIYFEAARKIPQAPVDFRFRRLVNYICDIYHHNLNGYKPPKTSRLNVRLRGGNLSSAQWSYFGSICTVHGVIDEDNYLANSDEQNFQYVLDIIHVPILNVAESLAWDTAVFKRAYQKTMDSNFKYHVELPVKSRKNIGHFSALVEKDMLTTYARINIVTTTVNKVVTVFTKENISCHDNAPLLAGKLKWFNDDQIGLELREFEIKLCYTISTDSLVSNLRFSRGNIYWESHAHYL